MLERGPSETSVELWQPFTRLEAKLNSRLDDFELALANATVDVVANPGMYSDDRYPEGLYNDVDSEARQLLASGQYQPALAKRYIELHEQNRALRDSFKESQTDDTEALNHLRGKIPAAILHEVYRIETPHQALHNLVWRGMGRAYQHHGGDFRPQISFLQGAYGLERPIDLLQPTEDKYANAVRRQLLSKNGAQRLYELEITAHHDIQVTTPEGQKTVTRQWMQEVVLRATDIADPEQADSYIFAASQTNPSKGGGKLLVGDIVQKVDSLGLEKLAAIRNYSGNYALSDYSPEQLERMARLASGDPELIAYLQQHDVTVVFTNKMGDHNNILSNVPEMTEDEAQRTLYVEIQSLDDIYRFATNIHASGILPSTYIFAIHGAKGQLPVMEKPPLGTTKSFAHILAVHSPAFVQEVTATDGRKEAFSGHAMEDMKGFARLTETYMQPSRAIDDPVEALGSKRQAFIACNSAADVQRRDLNTTGDWIKTDEWDSIVSRLAKDLAKSDVSGRIEIFGAGTDIQMRASARGIGYTSLKLKAEITDGAHGEMMAHDPLQASVFRLDNGCITRHAVDEILLRK